MGIFIALLSGALMSIQGVFNTNVTKESSLWVCNCFVQFTALGAGILVWMITDRTSFMMLKEVNPKYFLFGGILGTAITYTVVKAMSTLGPAKSVMIIVTAQILVAYLIEVFGLFGVEQTGFLWKKVVGVTLAIIGIILM